MCKRTFAALAIVALTAVLAPRLSAQTPPPYAMKKAINPGGNSYPNPGMIPYPDRDSTDHRVDLFMADWHESLPRLEHGSLIVRDILTLGDNMAPPVRGAVMERFNSLSHAILAAGNSTVPSKLQGQQEVYYILSGKGEVSAGGQTVAIQKDFAVFMPMNLEFVLHNTGDEGLTMYVINEPVRVGFKPVAKMVVKNERSRPPNGGNNGTSQYTAAGSSGHWGHITRGLFNRADGLASLGSVITVTLEPLTMGEPHTHEPGHEEIWAAIEGTSLAYIGTQLRIQKPGMAYMLRPDVTMTHSNLNVGDTPVKFLWFSASRTSDPGAVVITNTIERQMPKSGVPAAAER